jgi:hypothetical protein
MPSHAVVSAKRFFVAREGGLLPSGLLDSEQKRLAMEPGEKSSIPAAILAEAQHQHAILSRGTVAIYPGPDSHGLDGLHHKLAKSFADNRPLKVKLGIDPTAPDLHLGHCVVLNGTTDRFPFATLTSPALGCSALGCHHPVCPH